MPTFAAQQHSCAAAPVEKENALLPAIDVFCKLCAQRMTDRGLVPLPQLLPHIGNVHFRQRQIIESLVKGKHLIAPAFCGIGRFDRRRCRTEQQQRVILRAAELGNVARVIARRIFRLVACLLLLVEDNEADVRQRRKHSAACAKHNMHLAAADTLPLVVAFCERQRAVQHRNIIAELGSEAAQDLRRERDFRHEQHGSFSAAQCFLDEFQVDLRFAAGSHAVQQCGTAAFMAKRSA